MLKMEDLARHSDAELADIVTERCSAFGIITRVTVYSARPGGAAQPFAIVAMTTRAAAERLAEAFEGRTVGNAVVIFFDRPARSAARAVPAAARAAADPVMARSPAGHE